METFHAALTAQAARSELVTLKIKLSKFVYIKSEKHEVARYANLRKTLEPEEVLKSAINFKHSKLFFTLALKRQMQQQQ